MISFKTIKEITILIDSGVDPEIVGKIFKMDTKRIRNLYNKSKNIISKGMDEQNNDQSTGTSGTQTPSQPTSSKWGTGLNRGKANPIDQNSKWESGIARGKANPLS